MRELRLAALVVLLAAAACARSNGSDCKVQDDCATNVCCLTCAVGPCQGSQLGVCCSGTCASDGSCPAGTSCDGGICI